MAAPVALLGLLPVAAPVVLLVLLPVAAGAQPDWPERAASLAPMLRACLDGAGPGAFATEVAPAERGGWRILLHAGGGAMACTLRGGEVIGHVALAHAPPPDPAAPAFFLERRCVDARRVDGPDGRVLGWMAYPAC